MRNCACWAYVKKTIRTLSIRGTNFRACSASGKMWTVCTQAEHTRNEFHRTLSIRGTNFIPGWAYAEMFNSWISRPNQIPFSKILCYGPWDHKVSVSAKKVSEQTFYWIFSGQYDMVQYILYTTTMKHILIKAPPPYHFLNSFPELFYISYTPLVFSPSTGPNSANYWRPVCFAKYMQISLSQPNPDLAFSPLY
jgi:hypothetical protein